MEIEIISREYIKPSSPTPKHLRTHFICLLDQFAPPIYVTGIAFFAANYQGDSISSSKRSQVLKQSLSKILALYYPLAGRIIDDTSIDCNDEGAPYMVARCNCNLCDYLKQPDLSTLSKFLPLEIINSKMTPGGHTAMFQENLFACGGLAIGFAFPHNLFDGTSIFLFLKNWGTLARKGAVTQFPDFSTSYFFPQNSAFPQDLTAKAVSRPLFGRQGNFVVRRFVFKGSVISNLKDKATRLGVQKPTRVEVVVGLLFKCIMSASIAKSGSKNNKKYSALISTHVNLRRKAVPQLRETSVGNLLLLAGIEAYSEDTDLRSFVSQMRETLSPINGDFVKSLQGDQGLQWLCEYLKKLRESYSKAFEECIVFNSWCNGGTNIIDFGWGKNIWFPAVIFAKPGGANLIQLVDTRMSNGIEAWVSLDEEIMSMVENDQELLSMASVDPSPLEIDSLKSKL
ncbi:stemmadenine O-acetyltransferase-like [Tripterygium wilfordii]|uniref:stemmadenine O-acetyltransferase-like n=1 Tax=Tripterygium wilfordii TaxID=458696 RepID=UPI0018F821F5|nr:stemmadenine O-acetyltransferase-like [Tripterygium wilfordii]